MAPIYCTEREILPVCKVRQHPVLGTFIPLVDAGALASAKASVRLFVKHVMSEVPALAWIIFYVVYILRPMLLRFWESWSSAKALSLS